MITYEVIDHVAKITLNRPEKYHSFIRDMALDLQEKLDFCYEDKNVRSKFLNKAAKSLDYLALLVRDLLTISQMETGQIQMKEETFCIKELIQEDQK